MQNNNLLIILFISIFYSCNMHAQMTGLIKSGVNFGTINKKYWTSEWSSDSIEYNRPLIRISFGMGVEFTVSQNWVFRQEVFYQTKGQGTERPDVRTLFRTSSQDVLHFMSFPLSIHRRIVSDLYIGLSIQPSLYLTGSDNYYAKEPWHGWIWGSTVNLHYLFKGGIESGAEYDHDFTSYYCPSCDERFYTFRVYGMYHFL